ncbi:xanthine dehydrogenase/oxidase-like isoform X3 [Pomacea canaliculata]|uniref:xanthine dehydrogenase/oxidase-like isoform X3 n=1 Tax=Pomacea canaliculata TaxID=400727 RepID=UPI000D72A35C|nr:xanthine dehydrogenase/oxidase-like isoform X3 [Pomacea canaliculata]
MATFDVADLVLFVNGRKKVLMNPDPEMTLIQYLRSELQLTGTKKACGSGHCGACTVMVSQYLPDTKSVHHYSVNACLLPLCSIHGMAVTTVEGIGSLRTLLHPVQERIASAHGTQCGFCTPGFVMSMYTLLRNNPRPTLSHLNSAFDGNLCRCTGYRPILEGYRCFTEEECCGKAKNCCQKRDVNSTVKTIDGRGDESCFYDPTQEPIFPPYLMLEWQHLHGQPLKFVGPRVTWYRPTSLRTLLDIKKDNPNCHLIVGNTTIGLGTHSDKSFNFVVVEACHVKELTAIEKEETGIKFGASVTFASMERALRDVVEFLPEEKARVATAFLEMLLWFGSNQIRNVASIAGNILSASPTSDLNPLLLACGAILEVSNTDGERHTVKIDHSFFKANKQTAIAANEIVLSVFIPFSTQNEYLYGYQQATRKECDVSIVNAGMQVMLDTRDRVSKLVIAFGGLADTTVVAANTMEKLIGCTWNEDLLHQACALLSSDFPLKEGPEYDMVQYRKTLVVSFFFKFYLTVLHNLQQKVSSNRICSTDMSAIMPLEREAVKSLQRFEPVPDTQLPNDALRRPLVHESAYQQATGEALYLDDMAPMKGELYIAFVLSSKAHAKLVNVDPSLALKMPGVVDFISHVDIPGKKVWGTFQDDEVFAISEVIYKGQPVGAVLADTVVRAQNAASAVVVEYEELDSIITIEDAIEKKSFFDYNPCIEKGDVETAMALAENVLEGEFTVGAQEHFYLETFSVIVYPGEDGELEVFSSTQNPAGVQQALSAVLGLPLHKVTVRTKRIGGGFGGKELRAPLVALPAAVAAVKCGRPVRCILTREEDMVMTSQKHSVLAKYKIGFSSLGQIKALDCQFFLNGGCSVDISYKVLDKTIVDSDFCYMIPNLRARGQVCKTNLPTRSSFRGFGTPEAMLLIETALYKVATYLNMNFEELRELNFYKDGDTTHYNQVLEECNIKRCWEEVITQSNFHQRRRQVNLFNSENRWHKRGICLSPSKFGLGFFLPIQNQIASNVFQVPASKIRVNETSTSVVPNASPTADSLSSDLYVVAVLNACNILRERLKPIQEQNPGCSWEELIAAAYNARVSLSATGFYKTPDVSYDVKTNTGRPYACYTFGAACTEVEIDCLTGDHQVLRTDIIMDVGKSLNPAIDIGQIEGAFMQGYGILMLEKHVVQPDGTLLTRGSDTYKIPSMGNIPQSFNVSLLQDSGNTRAFYSSEGIGEPAMLLAGSVFFAVCDAIKAAREDEGLDPVYDMNIPATPDRIRMACVDRFTNIV